MQILKNKYFIMFAIIIITIVICMIANNNQSFSPARIEIWYDTTFDADIDLYSTGSGKDEKIYLGAQPTHYVIEANGSLYAVKQGEYKNAETGEIDPGTVIFIKKFDDDELKRFRKDLDKIIRTKEDKDGFPINFGDEFWFIKIDEKTYRVKAKLKISIIDKYF